MQSNQFINMEATANSHINNLSKLQQEFLSALQDPNAHQLSSLSHQIVGNSRLSEADSFSIYQRSYYLRLMHCMREQFPALCYALGEEIFDNFSKIYLSQYAPSSYTLYELGRKFPDFLYETRPNPECSEAEQETWVKFMLDLASFEHRAFSLFDAFGNEAREFAHLGTPDDNLVVQKCFRLAGYRFNVAEYYHAVRRNLNPSLPPPEHTKLALVRKDFITLTHYLSEPQYSFLSALQSGLRVKEAIDEVAKNYDLSIRLVRQSWNSAGGMRERWIQNRFFLDRDSLVV